MVEHNNFRNPFRKKKFQISFNTKQKLKELTQKYNQLEELHSDIYYLIQDFNYELDSLDLDPVFVDISVEIPASVTTDFINQMKDLTNLNELTDDDIDDIFYDILFNEKIIDKYFEIIEFDN